MATIELPAPPSATVVKAAPARAVQLQGAAIFAVLGAVYTAYVSHGSAPTFVAVVFVAAAALYAGYLVMAQRRALRAITPVPASAMRVSVVRGGAWDYAAFAVGVVLVLNHEDLSRILERQADWGVVPVFASSFCFAIAAARAVSVWQLRGAERQLGSRLLMARGAVFAPAS